MFDGLRGLCALGLLVVHVSFVASLIGSYTVPPTSKVAASILDSFQLGVGVFFLLSGLFLYRPFARAIITGTPRPALGPYFVRRALRLLPPYYVVTAAALLLLNFNSIHSLWYVLRPVVLMQNYNAVWMAGMDITWTVPTEVQWYIALPLIAWANLWYARRGATPAARARRLMVPVPILFLVGFGWFIFIHRPSMGIFPPQFWWPVGVAGNFGVGMALGIMSAVSQVSPEKTSGLFRLAARRPNLFWLAAVAVFALNSIKPFGRAGYGDYDTMGAALTFYVLFILFCALVVLPMVAPNAKSRLIDAVLTNRPVVFLGRISYGVYLWHFVVLNLYLSNGSIFGNDPLIIPFLRGRAGFWELESAVLAGTIAIATVSYYLLERPILQLGERRIQARQQRALAKVAAASPGEATERAA